MPAPRILIVDDQRDISRMLRAALGTLGGGSVILDVPSAEEAQLELRREPVDLLITDLRLPGISGLELIHKLRRASSDAAFIVISAYADEITRREVADAGATFYPKPLSLEDFLQGVRRLLGARLAAPAPTDTADDLPAALARLRREVAAAVVVLLDAHAALVAADGDLAALPLAALAAPLLTVVAAGRQVSAALGRPGGSSLTFVEGPAHDLYGLRVGLHHALLVFYAGGQGGAHIGPVMRSGRRAAEELLLLIGGTPAPTPTEPAPAAIVPDPRVTAPLRRRSPDTGPLRGQAPVPRPPAPPLTEAELQHLDDAAKTVTSDAAAAFWQEADHGDLGDDRSGTLSFEEAAKRGLFKSDKPKPSS
ncbi:MAG: response regulator transcription factor [Anaerolineales bacterium]|nr:response regulator transcription factor [Anaerolineales bacterium]